MKKIISSLAVMLFVLSSMALADRVRLDGDDAMYFATMGKAYYDDEIKRVNFYGDFTGSGFSWYGDAKVVAVGNDNTRVEVKMDSVDHIVYNWRYGYVESNDAEIKITNKECDTKGKCKIVKREFTNNLSMSLDFWNKKINIYSKHFTLRDIELGIKHCYRQTDGKKTCEAR